MEIAIGVPNAVPGAPGSVLPEWARRAEAAGFSSLGTIGRIVFDSHEELVALAAAAGATRRLRLVTTVMVGPARDTVLLAKQVATLDQVSGGRFALGLGVGWRDDDYRATGTDFARRGDALDRQVETLRRIWAGEPPASDVDPVGPRPSSPSGPPVWLGGSAPPALRRAGRLADAFIATPIAPEGVAAQYRTVCEAAGAAGRPAPPLVGAGYFALGEQAEAGRAAMRAYYAAGGEEFVRTMTGALLTDLDAVRAHLDGYQEIGVRETFLWPASCDPGQVEALAEGVL